MQWIRRALCPVLSIQFPEPVRADAMRSRRIEFDPANLSVQTVTAATHPQLVVQVVAMFEEVASEMAWKPGDQLTAYPTSSSYSVIEVEGRVAGALQLVRGGTSERLPVLKVWPELEADLAGRSDVADAALCAVRKEFRGQRHLYWALYAGAWRHCVRSRIREVWMELSPRKVSAYRSLGWPFTIEGPLRMQWEELCYPCRYSVRESGAAMIALARHSGTYSKTVDDEYQEAGVS
jgi:hypothetical protein